MSKKFIHPPGLKPFGLYTPVTVVEGGRTAYIAGQLAADSDGNVVGPGDVEAQTVKVFENLKVALDSIDASFDDIVKFTIFIVDFNAKRRKAVSDVRARYVSAQNPPASTMLGVDQLVVPDALVEIEAVVAMD